MPSIHRIVQLAGPCETSCKLAKGTYMTFKVGELEYLPTLFYHWLPLHLPPAPVETDILKLYETDTHR